MADVFITPFGKGWAVRVEGSSKVEKFDTQTQAIAHAREEAKARHSYVMLQNDKGELVQHASYRPTGMPDEDTDVRIDPEYLSKNR